MTEISLSAQAYSRLINLSQESRLRVRRVFFQLERNPLLGLQLWGRQDLYLYQGVGGLEVVYKLAQGQIQVVALKIPQERPSFTKDKICAIILAAGKGDYRGIPLQLLPMGGLPLISRLTEVFLVSDIDDLIVVLGYQAEQVKKKLADKDIKTVVNPNYKRGLSSSLRYGLRMVSQNTAAVMLTLGSRPFIKPEVVDTLIATYKKREAPIVAPVYHQIRGHPVIFNASLIPELLKVRGNVGGREVIRRHREELTEVKVEDAGIFKKIKISQDGIIKINAEES